MATRARRRPVPSRPCHRSRPSPHQLPTGTTVPSCPGNQMPCGADCCCPAGNTKCGSALLSRRPGGVLRRGVLLWHLLRGRTVLPVVAGILRRQRAMLWSGRDLWGRGLWVGNVRGNRRGLHHRQRLLRPECLRCRRLRRGLPAGLPGVRSGLLSRRLLHRRRLRSRVARSVAPTTSATRARRSVRSARMGPACPPPPRLRLRPKLPPPPPPRRIAGRVGPHALPVRSVVDRHAAGPATSAAGGCAAQPSSAARRRANVAERA